METKDTCFCDESFIDRSFLVLEILRGVLCDPLFMTTHAKNPMLKRLNDDLIEKNVYIVTKIISKILTKR